MPLKISHLSESANFATPDVPVRDFIRHFEQTALAALKNNDCGHIAHLGPIPLPFHVGAHDGKLKAEEIVDIFHRNGVSLSPVILKQLTGPAGKGELTYEKFVQVVSASLRSTLNQIDTNHDGKIEPDEFSRYLRERGQQEHSSDPRSLKQRPNRPPTIV